MRSKLLIAVVVVVAIIGIGVGVGLLAGGGSVGHPHAAPVHPPDPEANTQPAPPVETQHPVTQPPPTQARPIIAPEPAPIQTNIVAVAPTNPPAGGTNWEDTIDDIVGSEDADTNKVKQLFALFPKLPPDGQEEAVQHLSNLVEDDNYAPLGELLKNAKMPEGVLDELLADALNRPNSLKLPLLLDVARNPDHAKHEEAKDLLELYLGEDYGSDWNTWQEKLKEWQKQNPD